MHHQYDSTGQTTQKTYTYTAANLLESITHNSVSGTPVTSMEWDADSNRVAFTSSEGGTWEFVYDPTAGIPAVIEEVNTGPFYYIREPDGSLIARVTTNGTRYYHFDALGSTRMLTDEDGEVTATYSYTDWGSLEDFEGETNQPYRFVGQLGYYTHYQDGDFPFLQLGVRFYDMFGRFTQAEMGLPLESYRYAFDRPTIYVDADGEFPKLPKPNPIGIGKGGLNWYCKLYPDSWFCKNIWKPFGKAQKCLKAFDCTQCAAGLMDDASKCKNAPPLEDILEPPYNGNALNWKMRCMERVAKKHKGESNLVECVTKCVKIPLDMMGGMTPGRL